MYTCEYCNKTLKTKASLFSHQKKTKSCLALRGLSPPPDPLKAGSVYMPEYDNYESSDGQSIILAPTKKTAKQICHLCMFGNKAGAIECSECFCPFKPEVEDDPRDSEEVKELKRENRRLQKKLQMIGDDLAGQTFYCLRMLQRNTPESIHFGGVMPETQTLDLTDIEPTKKVIESVIEFIDDRPELLAQQVASELLTGEFHIPKYVCTDKETENFGFKSPGCQWNEDPKAEKLILHLTIAGATKLTESKYREKFLKELLRALP